MTEMKKLDREFYLSDDVVSVARGLLGKKLMSNVSGIITGGYITETEAYNGIIDKASHAYNGRFTRRTSVMYRQGGCGYLYLCYGIHTLFNVVSNMEGTPHAVLVRGLYPTVGTDHMASRMNSDDIDQIILDGPGKVSKAMGMHYSMSGVDLMGDLIWIEESGFSVSDPDISISSRIGIEYAAEDAGKPYRFYIDPKRMDGFLNGVT